MGRFDSPLRQRHQNLILEITRSGRKVQDWAKDAGMSPSRLSQIMYGLAWPPTKENKKKLAVLLGRSESWLFRKDTKIKDQIPP